jgi:ribonuclease J
VEHIKILPLGGLGEIGLNCMAIESKTDLILIDAGIYFSQLDAFGVNFLIPDFSIFKNKKDKFKAILLTHGHEDHIGGLPFLLKTGIHVPILCSEFTAALVRERLKDSGLSNALSLIKVIHYDEPYLFGSFEVRFIPVAHSIVDSCALFIDTPYGKIVHTGDFKIDPTPFMGPITDMDYFAAHAGKVSLLMSDSTNVERCDASQSDTAVYDTLERLFVQSKGLTVVSLFASNIARIGQIAQLAKRFQKRIFLAGRSMEQNIILASELGYLDDQIFVDSSQLHSIPRNKLIVVSTGSQAEPRSALSRMAHNAHPLIKIEPNDLIILSSKFIPGNEKAIGQLINKLFEKKAHVFYETLDQIHVSGHATRPELKEMIRRVKPRHFIPIHGEYRHLAQHAKVALETGMPAENVHIALNGDTIELSKKGVRLHKQSVELNPQLVDQTRSFFLPKELIKTRKKIAQAGVVFSVITLNDEQAGFHSLEMTGVASHEMQDQIKNDLKKAIYQGLKKAPNHSLHETKRSIESTVQRYFKTYNNEKMTVIPVVVDMDKIS